MNPKPLRVEPLSRNRLRLFFENGEKRIFDASAWLERGLFSELKDKELFRGVRISFDSVEWPNGADICPELLYEQSVPATDEAAEDEPDYR